MISRVFTPAAKIVKSVACALRVKKRDPPVSKDVLEQLAQPELKAGRFGIDGELRRNSTTADNVRYVEEGVRSRRCVVAYVNDFVCCLEL